MFINEITIVGDTSTVLIGADLTWSGGSYGYVLQDVQANPAPLEGSSLQHPRRWGGIGGNRIPGIRNIRLTGLVLARNIDEANRLRDDLVEAVYASVDPVKLRFTRDSVAVEWEAYLSGSPDISSALSSGGMWAASFDLVFVAEDPRIYSQTSETITPSTGGSAATNDGNTSTYPVFTIGGPASGTITGLVLENETSGEALTLTGISLVAGDTLLVDCTPGFERVQKGSTSYIGSRSSDSEFWALDAGSSTVSYSATGGTPATISCAFRHAWSS